MILCARGCFFSNKKAPLHAGSARLLFRPASPITIFCARECFFSSKKAPLHIHCTGAPVKARYHPDSAASQPSAAKARAFHGANPPQTTKENSPAKLGEEKLCIDPPGSHPPPALLRHLCKAIPFIAFSNSVYCIQINEKSQPKKRFSACSSAFRSKSLHIP